MAEIELRERGKKGSQSLGPPCLNFLLYEDTHISLDVEDLCF
jgi:hypothetical protein